jgi:hypothetical protein
VVGVGVERVDEHAVAVTAKHMTAPIVHPRTAGAYGRPGRDGW